MNREPHERRDINVTHAWYFYVTTMSMHEGNGISARRAGLYAAIRHGKDGDARETGDGLLSGLVSLSASCRLTQRWFARVTRYSRDTDILLGGVGYRF